MATDYLNQFFTAQKNMFDAWQNTFTPNAGETKAENKPGADFMNFSSFQQNTMENFKQLTDFYNNFLDFRNNQEYNIVKNLVIRFLRRKILCLKKQQDRN